MKNYLKTSKWLRWAVAGAFGLMLALNIMVSLDFDKGNLLPSLTLVELGNQAYASGESGGTTNCYAGGVLTSSHFPVCQEHCPYQYMNNPQKVGTCNF